MVWLLRAVDTELVCCTLLPDLCRNREAVDVLANLVGADDDGVVSERRGFPQ